MASNETVVIGGSDNVTASQLKELFKQIDQGSITKHVLQIFLENKILENKDVIDLLKKLAQQDKYIKDMRDVLRYCARNDVGTYYQQNVAREMLKGTKITMNRNNPDGTYNESYLKWIFSCGGQEAVDETLAYEKELLSLSAE